jgi:hypothetical protein
MSENASSSVLTPILALFRTSACWIATALSLAFIGNASAAYIAGKAVDPNRGVFDKETRRKPLAFAADAYGISMLLLHERARQHDRMAGERSWCKHCARVTKHFGVAFLVLDMRLKAAQTHP